MERRTRLRLIHITTARLENGEYKIQSNITDPDRAGDSNKVIRLQPLKTRQRHDRTFAGREKATMEQEAEASGQS